MVAFSSSGECQLPGAILHSRSPLCEEDNGRYGLLPLLRQRRVGASNELMRALRAMVLMKATSENRVRELTGTCQLVRSRTCSGGPFRVTLAPHAVEPSTRQAVAVCGTACSCTMNASYIRNFDEMILETDLCHIWISSISCGVRTEKVQVGVDGNDCHHIPLSITETSKTSTS